MEMTDNISGFDIQDKISEINDLKIIDEEIKKNRTNIGIFKK